MLKKHFIEDTSAKKCGGLKTRFAEDMLRFSRSPFHPKGGKMKGIKTIPAEGSLPVRHVLWRAPFHPALLQKVRDPFQSPWDSNCSSPARQCRFSRLDFIKEMTKIDKVNWKKGE